MNLYEREPDILITDKIVDVTEENTVFGKRWWSQLVRINDKHLEALAEGKYLALDVQGEYVVYLQAEREGDDV